MIKKIRGDCFIVKIIENLKNYIGWKYFDFITNQEMKYENSEPFCETEDDIANDVFDLFQDIINQEELLEEEWTSDSNENKHFKKHCVGKTKKHSILSNVRYDFTNIQDFDNYSDKILKEVTKPDFRITTLYDIKKVFDALNILSQKDTNILFTSSCGFENHVGIVNIGIHSFANESTTNYNKDTIDIIILSNHDEIISIYPIDISRINNKFKSIIKKYSYDEKIKELYKTYNNINNKR